MSFPSAPDARIGGPRSFWWAWADPRETPVTPYLMQSGWPSIVSRAQKAAKSIMEYGKQGIYVFANTGECYRGSEISAIPAALAANIRRVEAITVDGILGPESKDAIGAVLCFGGHQGAARELAASFEANGAISANLVRYLIWLGSFVKPQDVFDPQGQQITTNAATNALGAGISIPENAILPHWGDRLTQTADPGWIGQSRWGSPYPVSPSEGGGTKPWPQTMGPATTTTTTATTTTQWVIAGAVIVLGAVALTRSRSRRRR